ncbi:MAG: hypothetical protein IJY02_02710 [Oscillospiraceae bacterium]|nr:hypothetical protein [Oscillospiraceae bacterium]
MKKYINGQYVDLTAEEITTLQEEEKKAEARERHRPYSVEEVTRLLLKERLNFITTDDQTALRMAEFYPTWDELVGKTAKQAGFRFSHGGNLYKTISADHTFSSEWVPGKGTESLYTRIDAEHAGDLYDPILYEGNMELNEGIYYSQQGVVYRCTRSTGMPVYAQLKDMISISVEQICYL